MEVSESVRPGQCSGIRNAVFPDVSREAGRSKVVPVSTSCCHVDVRAGPQVTVSALRLHGDARFPLSAPGHLTEQEKLILSVSNLLLFHLVTKRTSYQKLPS